MINDKTHNENEIEGHEMGVESVKRKLPVRPSVGIGLGRLSSKKITRQPPYTPQSLII